MDHIDFRNSVITGPFVGKSVTQVTQTVTTVARPDDKMYVVMRSDFYDDGELTDPIGVAMSRERANAFVKSYNIEGATLVSHEMGTDGSWYRHFEYEGTDLTIESTAVFVAVVPTI